MVTKKTKIVDKWKLKKWYTIIAPSIFENKEIGEIVATDESSFINRVIKISLGELLSSKSHSATFTTLFFRIAEVKGNHLSTKLIGHEVSSSYIRTFARRGKDLIHMVVDRKTKDNEDVRLKVVCVTDGKISENTSKSLRAAIVDELKKNSEAVTYDELVQEMLYGKLVSRLFNRLKQIASMRRVEIRKSERKERFG